ncbi:MAG: hypothetical protein K2L21_06645, partial [Muribaculaceae bacterium]|nr:hypothetical protein [Muribaculaceae bacterium]
MKARFYIPVVLSLALALPAAAQNYDDDIYYNPDKARKAAAAKNAAPKSSNAYITGNAAAAPASADYPAADTYTPAAGSGLNMSVDEYNRRGAYAAGAPADSAASETDAFAYTRRIERFHNPDIVAESDDDEFVEYYYATDPVVLNVNVIDINPWDWWGPRYSWYSPSMWYSSYWNPWYNWSWGPTWNWNFGWGWGGWYDPYWSWAGGWGPSWG